ncbi:FAD-dependent oxidoreductase [Actinomadura welshii]|uniref:FAD-dependent oxidoreductase n=1 Tax=Actinomadura welshii TaxID=3103817 RepID=UPI00040A12E8|nr:GMC family oxidoreductase [Actinomadura madurae]
MGSRSSPYLDTDVCIVGGGASGAVAAHLLSRRGLRVLLLEEGGRIDGGAGLKAVEPDWETALVPGRDGTFRPLGKPWSARALGGGMRLFAGIGFRFREVDFDARGHVAADALDPRWPIGYGDLRPGYDEIEALFGIARADGADPLEPPAAPPRMPPHPFSAQGAVLAEAGTALGLRPFPTPLLINSVPYRGRPACVHCGPCNEYACPVGAKADVAETLLRTAARGGTLTVATRSKALRIGAGRFDRADHVEWLDLRAMRRHVTRARIVVLAANAVQSAALLLRSGNRWSPDGLGNRYDMVGRGLCFKVSGYANATVPSARAPAGPTAGPFSTVAFTDHYLDDASPTGLGGVLYEASPEDRAPRAGRLPLRLHYHAADQPMWRNRVRLGREPTPLGVPKLIMDYATHPVDRARLGHLADRAARLLRSAGATDVAFEASRYQHGSRHLHGGCRAGDDPAGSVVDRDGRMHDLENVYVVDGGFFPYPGGVNPTLTILANAVRISRRIAAGLTAGAATAVPLGRSTS